MKKLINQDFRKQHCFHEACNDHQHLSLKLFIHLHSHTSNYKLSMPEKWRLVR